MASDIYMDVEKYAGHDSYFRSAIDKAQRVSHKVNHVINVLVIEMKWRT